MMTPRERILTTLSGGTPDKVPWFGDLDYWATALVVRGEKPRDFKSDAAYLAWHRELDLGFYLQGSFPFTAHYDECEITETVEGPWTSRAVRTPRGVLRERSFWSDRTFSSSPVERLVKSPEDLPAYRSMVEHARYEPDYGPVTRRAAQTGDQGISLCYLPRSPFMELVVEHAGIESVAMIQADAPEELGATLDAMRESQAAACRLALESPAEVLMIPENLSSEVVGERFFEMYVRDDQVAWARRIAEAGRYSCIHMDGSLRGLLRQESSIGLTFIEGMTPAPVGDVALPEWDSFRGGSGVIYWGGIPGPFFTAAVDDATFDRFVVQALSVMRNDRRYVLGVADQVPPDALESRVRRVAELVDVHGRYA